MSKTEEDIQTLSTASSHFAQRSHALIASGVNATEVFLQEDRKETRGSFWLKCLAQVAAVCVPVRSSAKMALHHCETLFTISIASVLN